MEKQKLENQNQPGKGEVTARLGLSSTLTEKGSPEILSDEQKAADVLRTIARDPDMKDFVMRTPWLYRILYSAAKRYVAGEQGSEAVRAAVRLRELGYRQSLEFIGENTADAEECRRATDEFLALIKESSQQGLSADICFDLSHIGLLFDEKLALENAEELARCAKEHGQYVMMSMEESAKTSAIYRVYEQLASRMHNIGITVQSHLHRTIDDLPRLLALPGKIRLVKGAFKEAPEVALPRSAELRERYLSLAEQIVRAGHPLSIATHDDQIVKAVLERGYLGDAYVELEMLFGVREEAARALLEGGIPIRLYVTYGTEWYLYLCHRLAEHPPNLYRALADMLEPGRAGVEMYG
ncbi:proline dehydrogenase family protein [Brevibacillus borstelensis]|uniref:proline dehydrogenase family protein n=1 Tax=Brevibacillus borstelensis TaxID=45462 RepID=UPI003CE51FD5